MITQIRLKELIGYNQVTGAFINITARQRVKIGSFAGNIASDGYARIMIDGKSYQAHRLAWLYVNGRFPVSDIDHINGIRSDNRIANLRDVSRSQNNKNRKCHREGHLVGTSFFKRSNKWNAQIRINGKRKSLGYYSTQIEAYDAYMTEVNAFNLNF